jgi:hypothetical protein
MEEEIMKLTIDRTDFRSGRCQEQSTSPSTHRGSPSVDGWLSAMYGVRPQVDSRRTSSPMTDRHVPGIADWLRSMWGLVQAP